MKRLRIKNILFIALTLLLTGCANTIGTGPDIGYSGFDNAKTVTINPHGNICSSMTLCTGIGAQWNESTPETAILVVAVFGEFEAISGATLNIDGRKVTLKPAHSATEHESMVGTTTFKESYKGFIIPVTELENVVSAKRVWLRISTPTGSLEGGVVDGSKDSKAYHALKRFLKAVKTA